MMGWQADQTNALKQIPRLLGDIVTALREQSYEPERRAMSVTSEGIRKEGVGYIDRATGWVHLTVEGEEGDQEWALPPGSVQSVRWLP